VISASKSPAAVPARLDRGVQAAVVVAAGLAGWLEIRSVDFFWHLAAGRWMGAERALPRVDPFRFGAPGVPWVDHEWGFQLLLALGERLGGLPVLVLGRAVLLAALAALLLQALARRGVPVPLSGLLVLAAVLGLRQRFLLRPELLSLLGLTLLLALLERRRAGGGARLYAGVALLVVLWANVHPGVLVAPIVAGLYLLGAGFDRREGAEQEAPRLARSFPFAEAVAGTLLAALAILANPWGVEVYRVPWAIRGALAGLPVTNPDWAPLWREPRPALLLALLGLAALILLARRRGVRLDPALGLVVAALSVLAVSGARHQGMLWIGLALFAGACLGDLARRGALAPAWGGRRALAATLAAALLAAAWCVSGPLLGPLAPTHRPGLGVAPGLFPDSGVAALARHAPVGNLFNAPAFGGYLLYRLNPPRQVFWDTRNEVDPARLREVVEARRSAPGWQALLDRYAIDGALLGYEEVERPVVVPGAAAPAEAHTASALLFPRESFALVHWDDVSMLFLARTPQRAARLASEEYRFVQPEDWRATLRRAAADPQFREAVRRELERQLAEDPACRRAAQLLALLR
jgi:hypothetical protein